ncbi:hypothetical protein HY489_06410 [Candidatus Woesearchaeota archaeon]|nr:hypothetical protein [Candidatus Woesearchaeota archaeon]
MSRLLNAQGGRLQSLAEAIVVRAAIANDRRARQQSFQDPDLERMISLERSDGRPYSEVHWTYKNPNTKAKERLLPAYKQQLAFWEKSENYQHTRTVSIKFKDGDNYVQAFAELGTDKKSQELLKRIDGTLPISLDDPLVAKLVQTARENKRITLLRRCTRSKEEFEWHDREILLRTNWLEYSIERENGSSQYGSSSTVIAAIGSQEIAELNAQHLREAHREEEQKNQKLYPDWKSRLPAPAGILEYTIEGFENSLNTHQKTAEYFIREHKGEYPEYEKMSKLFKGDRQKIALINIVGIGGGNSPNHCLFQTVIDATARAYPAGDASLVLTTAHIASLQQTTGHAVHPDNTQHTSHSIQDGIEKRFKNIELNDCAPSKPSPEDFSRIKKRFKNLNLEPYRPTPPSKDDIDYIVERAKKLDLEPCTPNPAQEDTQQIKKRFRKLEFDDVSPLEKITRQLQTNYRAPTNPVQGWRAERQDLTEKNKQTVLNELKKLLPIAGEYYADQQPAFFTSDEDAFNGFQMRWCDNNYKPHNTEEKALAKKVHTALNKLGPERDSVDDVGRGPREQYRSGHSKKVFAIDQNGDLAIRHHHVFEHGSATSCYQSYTYVAAGFDLEETHFNPKGELITAKGPDGLRILWSKIGCNPTYNRVQLLGLKNKKLLPPARRLLRSGNIVYAQHSDREVAAYHLTLQTLL